MTTFRSPIAGCAVAATLLLASCGSGDAAPSAAGDASAAAVDTENTSTGDSSNGTSSTVAVTTTEVPPTTAPPAEGSDDSVLPTATTEPPPTSDPCEVKCPIGDDERAAVQRTIDAYNSGDWEAFLATVVEAEPDWETPIGPQSADLVRFDFGWSAALNGVWTLGECFTTHSDVACDVSIADDVHRGLGPIGLPPSECRIYVQFVDGLVDIRRYDLAPCHSKYDSAFHGFGRWFEENYPDLDPVQGLHYRAWNQTDLTAPARAAEHLGEYVAFRRDHAGLDPWDPGDLTHEYPDDGDDGNDGNAGNDGDDSDDDHDH
jgi:hypothetical protein